LASVAGAQDTPEQVALDSSHIKIHRCASGGKGGPKRRRSASLDQRGASTNLPGGRCAGTGAKKLLQQRF
jgi:hypothetical protein